MMPFCFSSWASIAIYVVLQSRKALSFTPHVSPLHRHAATTRLYTSSSSKSQEDLLSDIALLNEQQPRRLPCGLECSDKERARVAQRIEVLLESPENVVTQKRGQVDDKDLVGHDWNLLYTSSRTMQINKSLSGLGRSESEMANVAEIRMKLSGSKYLGFVEFVERMGTGPDAFDVTVTGEWYFEAVSDPFTGGPATAVRCDLERVKYLTFDNQAETWASLGPIKLMDIVYLAEDLLITRGNVNPDALFVFQKR